MTALLQALGLGSVERASFFIGRCGACGQRFWVETRGTVNTAAWHVSDSKGCESAKLGGGVVEVTHLCAFRGRVWRSYLQRVQGKRSAVKCGARCTGATGHQCECSCGGRNHGRG